MYRYVIMLLIVFPGLHILRDDAGVQAQALPGRPVLHAQAMEESLLPIRPGIPGEVPFWNAYARRFIHAPAFDFKTINGAVKYRFTAVSEKNGESYVFEALQPRAPLVPVWDKIPVGYVRLTVEGISHETGEPVGIAGERRFYRAAAYNGPYHEKAMDYRESGMKGMRYLFESPIFQHWKTHGEPYPEYGLYCYPSKMFTSVVGSMLRFRELTDDPAEKEDALLIAETAAKYLVMISMPQGSPLEYMPPTYTGKIYADMEERFVGDDLSDRIMMIYPAGAGGTYLRLYEVTGNILYLNAAEAIAETYIKFQMPSGSWPLLIHVKTGESLSENVCAPGGIASFLTRLADKYGFVEYRDAAARAERWIEENTVKDFNFEAQFEDQAPVEKYKNLSKGPAISYAMKLFATAGDDWRKIREAEELLQFAEDQFVVWEQPLDFTDWDSDSKVWITPCVLEQYNFYVPVDASASQMISAYRRAYEVTKKPLYLAKAIDLANTMTVAQDPETGRFPTYWERNYKLDLPGWINCAAGCASTMIEFGKFLEELEK